MKYKIIVRIICTIFAMCLMVSLYSCNQSKICIKEKSFYSEFKVQDGKVYIYCTLYIDNLTGAEKNIAVQAFFKQDVKNGLLKDALVDGYLIEGNTKCLKLKEGENRFDVVFIGEHAGQHVKHDRNLPDIKITELD